MEFLNSIDFILLGLVICMLREMLHLFRIADMVDIYVGQKDPNISIGNLLVSLFSLVFIIYLLWTPYWLSVIILLVLGVITQRLTKKLIRRYKEIINECIGPNSPELMIIKNTIRAYVTIDIILCSLIIAWTILLHLMNLGIVA